jgi:predicted DNA-binding transcriptional regulator AlpA
MLNTPDRVNTVQQVAERCGLSIVALRRILATGDGPKTTQLSARRMGIRESHLLEWLDARVRDQDEHQQDDEAA